MNGLPKNTMRGRVARVALVACAVGGVAVAQSGPPARAPGSFHDTSMRGTEVGTGRAPAAESAPLGTLRGDSTPQPDQITGPIGPADVARIMRAQMPRLQPCYDRARATRPTLAGRIEVRFTLSRDGRATRVSAQGIPEAPEVALCVVDVLRQTVFPQPEPAPLQFFYPLMFNPPPVASSAPPARGRGRGRPAAPARPRSR